MTRSALAFFFLSLFPTGCQSLDIHCGSVDFEFILDECVSPSQLAVRYGNCTSGVWSEEFFADDCPVNSPNCFECGTSRVICSSLDNAVDACNQYPSTIPADVDCATIGTGRLEGDTCTSSTGWAFQQLECSNGQEIFRSFEQGLCSDDNPELTYCLDCGVIGFCHAGDPTTTTCASFGVGPSLDSSTPTCNNIDFAFSSDQCMSATQYAARFGNCTDGRMEQENFIVDCFSESPYCHDCSDTRVVCSESSNFAEACGEFPPSIPSGVDCASVGTGFISQVQCTSSTSYAYEYLDCDNGSVFDIDVDELTCASEDPDRVSCLDCGTVGYCHAGDPATTTCESLGLPSPASPPSPTQPPGGNPTNPPSGDASLRTRASFAIVLLLLGILGI